MKALLELIARSLVDRRDEVSVEEFQEDGAVVFELRVPPEELGKIIGRQGRTAKAIRSILNAAGMKHRRRYVLEIIE